MLYHNPSLKKLIKEPKETFSRLCGGRNGAKSYFSDGHWLLSIQSDALPAALAGFEPRYDEPDGYRLQAGDRQTPGPDFDAVIPKTPNNNDAITVTQWTVELARYPLARLFKGPDGRKIFADNTLWAPLVKAFNGRSMELTQDGEGSPICAWLDNTGKSELAFLLMPLRVSEAEIEYPIAS